MIQARQGSKRFPNKLIQDLLGLSILQHTVERILMVKEFDSIALVSGDKKILDIKFSKNINRFKTHKKHPNGTSRISEISKKLTFDYCLIVQADEPLIIPKYLSSFISKINKKKIDNKKIYNFVTKIKVNDLKDKSIVKVFTESRSNEVIFYQRHIDIDLKSLINKNIYQSIGVYCIPKKIIDNFSSLTKGSIEKISNIEQFRYLENNIKIEAHHVLNDFGSVNYDSDIIRTKKKLLKSKLQKKIYNKYFDKYR